MKKVLLSSILALGSLCTLNAQMTEGVQARIYAYGLQQTVGEAVVENGTITSYTLTFKTNTAATSAKVNLMNGETVVASFEAEATDATKKSWKAVVNASKVANAGTYTWVAEVSAPAVENFQELVGTPTYSDKKSDFRFYRSFGLEVNKTPESEYFGNVYAVHQFVTSSNITNYRETGIYVYSPELVVQNDGNPYKNNIYGAGETATKSGLSPADMCIAEDGRLFITSIDETNYNVYSIDPSTFNVSKVFNNATVKADDNKINALYASDGTTRMTGLRGTLTVYGTGENTTLMTLEPKDIYTKLWTTPINEFKIGKNNTWDQAPTNVIAESSAKCMKSKDNGNVHIANGDIYTTLEATKNGFWAVQFKTSPTKNEPTIFYYSRITGKVEYLNINDFISNKTSTALAVNDGLGLVAYTTTGATTGTPAVVLKYTEDAENGAVTVDEINGSDYIMTVLGSKADAMTFDYAGNLYAITSGNETMAVYALPDDFVGPNTRITPAKSTMTIEITANDIQTGVEEVGVDANAPVEYYNLQGVKVENPSNGIFIKKQGSRTSKVVL